MRGPDRAGAGRREAEWLDLVAELMAVPLTTFPEARLAEALNGTFGGRGCAFNSRTGVSALAVQRIWPSGAFGSAEAAEINHWAAHHAARAHPVLRYYLATRDPAVKQVDDVPSVFAGRRVVDAWYEVGRVWRVPAQLAMPVQFDRAGHRAFVLGREDPYTAEEVVLAGRLQRLLTGLDRQITALAGAGGTVDREPAADLRLTARELAVLALAADGLTSAAVARRLLVAERTVHKHLQNAYTKLGVSDRLSAVLRARHLGLLAGRTAP